MDKLYQRVDLRVRITPIAWLGFATSIGSVFRSTFFHSQWNNVNDDGYGMKPFFLVLALFNLLRVPSYFWLQHTVKKNKRTGVLLWLKSFGVLTVINALLMLLTIIFFTIAEMMEVEVLIIVIGTVGVAYDIFIWVVVLNFHKQMIEEEKTGSCIKNIDNAPVSDVVLI